jgi:hypothetical protein
MKVNNVTNILFHIITAIFKLKLMFMQSGSGNRSLLLISGFLILLAFTLSCGEGNPVRVKVKIPSGMPDSVAENGFVDEARPVYALLVVPPAPQAGEPFRIVATGGKNIRKARMIVTGPSGILESHRSRAGEGLPYWREDAFGGCEEGTYGVTLVEDKKKVLSREFVVKGDVKSVSLPGRKENSHGWDSGTEALYASWVNALFQGCDERSDWVALHEVTQNRERNFLYNYLSLGEDDPDSKNSVIMQPDCADNPFFFRAYFAWKLGLPFGYHVCDRGSLGHPPRTGQWITSGFYAQTIPVTAFNSLLRRLKDGIHSGTARTALENENADYYPVALEKGYLRPGTVFADPYGHTLVITGWIAQTRSQPGMLLAVDAQPDGTVGIKRFWKGNFLYNTSGVVGEPGFKAFRPIIMKEGKLQSLKNGDLTGDSGYVPFSLQQQGMVSEDFYKIMERLINPKPQDPEDALLSLIRALHEQLMVRVTSVANGEAWFKKHPGSVISMPASAAGIFQTGGLWEDFSTPNRDLRLLIAMDAVLDFPERIVSSPEDFEISGLTSPEEVRKKLLALLDKKTSELTITYTRTDGSEQILTLSEIIRRKEAFEAAYNPNDGIEIRWGAPEGSEERSACRRFAPPGQIKTMQSVREWFQKRLHPPT